MAGVNACLFSPSRARTDKSEGFTGEGSWWADTSKSALQSDESASLKGVRLEHCKNSELSLLQDTYSGDESITIRRLDKPVPNDLARSPHEIQSAVQSGSVPPKTMEGNDTKLRYGGMNRCEESAIIQESTAGLATAGDNDEGASDTESQLQDRTWEMSSEYAAFEGYESSSSQQDLEYPYFEYDDAPWWGCLVPPCLG